MEPVSLTTAYFSTSEPQNSPIWTVFPSTVIASWGVIFNIFSLSYFVNRKRESLGNKLLILLNILDLLVCVLAVVMLGMMVKYWRISEWVHETVQMLYFVFLEATGFATCLLSAARCISLCWPFYNVKGHYIAFSAVLVLSYTLSREMVMARIVDRETYYLKGLSKIHMGILQSEIGLMILVVLLTNICSILKLRFKPNKTAQSSRNNIQATTTVAILSVFYCFLHGCYLVTGILYFFCGHDLNNGSWLLYFGIFYAAPLNSAINPLIYMLRKRDMKRYLKGFTRSTLRSMSSSRKISEEKQNVERLMVILEKRLTFHRGDQLQS